MERGSASDAHQRSTASSKGPRIVVVSDADALADEAARHFIETVNGAIERHGTAHVSLTGGSSAGALYIRLARDPMRHAIDWGRVHLWFGDERRVPVDHPESNQRLAYDILTRASSHGGQSGEGDAGTDVEAGIGPGVPIPMEQVHGFLSTALIGSRDDADRAASRYADSIRRRLAAGPEGVPRFDLMLLGVGSDGHILSVFPGSPALRPDAPLVMAVPAPTTVGPAVARMTLSPRLVRAAASVLVMVPGGDKADVVAEILGGDYDPDRWPAQLARTPQATWLLTEAAASRLSRS
jgi:6-phosphogluconolactonase